MSTTTVPLPIVETWSPTQPQEVAEMLRAAWDSRTPVYPIGGGSSLQYGLPARDDGVALELSRLNQVIDYPARDLTVTVGAGVTLNQLGELLGSERQQLPVDVPQPGSATLGGIVATAWNGPRRYGHGSVRDFVIGIRAVDGRGRAFRGGGRVVKNVAGYDFCKLLTGSLGTLAVITELTLKLKPQAEAFQWLGCRLERLTDIEPCLARIGQSPVTPAAIQVVGGPAWSGEAVLDGLGLEDRHFAVLVALEGTAAEVAWMEQQLISEWKAASSSPIGRATGERAQAVLQRCCDFADDRQAPLIVKGVTVPSGTSALIAAAREMDSACSITAQAGNGITFVRFSEFPADGLARTLIARLQPVAARHHGSVTMLWNEGGGELTRQSVWGCPEVPLMRDVKQQFDPRNLLNRGRFVYAG